MKKLGLETLGGRIRDVRTRNRLTQEEFAARLLRRLKKTNRNATLSRGAVGNWELGNDRPEMENLRAIATEFDEDINVLLYGSSRKDRDQQRGIEPFEHDVPPGFSEDGDSFHVPEHGIVEIDIRAGLGGGGVASREMVKHGNSIDPVKPDAWHFPSDFLHQEVRVPASRLRVIEAGGDSMFPTIQSGARLLIDVGHVTPSPDGLYALRDQFGVIVVKRLQVMRGDPPTVKIISDNRNHREEEVPIDDIHIIGKVVIGFQRF